MSRDPRIDQKIAAAAPFAQPILSHIRDTMHEAVPGIEETIKWGMPFFLRGGRPFANMSAFKAHAAFGFWRGREPGKEEDAMGQFGRLTSLDDLPPKPELLRRIHEAVADADARDAAPAKPKAAPKAAIAEPDDFVAALAGNVQASAGWDTMTPGARREYLEWIVSAKRPETRAARIEKAASQLSEGKKLNWKYENC